MRWPPSTSRPGRSRPGSPKRMSFIAHSPPESLPESLEIRRAERAVIQSVARPPALAPDHPPVVWAHRTGDPRVAQCSQHVGKSHVARRMRRLVKLPLARDAHVAAVRKVDAWADAAHHRWKVVLGEGAERARAECHAVGGAVDEFQESIEISATANDSRQPEDGPGRVVGVDCHAHARLLCDGDNAFEEVGETLPKAFRIHLSVRHKQRAQLVSRIGCGPSRETNVHASEY